MPREILQIDDVRSRFAGGSERGDAEPVHGDVGVELQGFHVTLDQLFDRPGGHRLGAEAVASVAAYGFLGAEERAGFRGHGIHGVPRGSGDTIRNSIQRRRNGQCHPNATPGVSSDPLRKYPSTIRRKFNAGAGIRTHTLVPQERIYTVLCLQDPL